MHTIRLVLDFNSRKKVVTEVLSRAKESRAILWSETVRNVLFQKSGGIVYAELPVTIDQLPKEYQVFPWLRFQMNFTTSHKVNPGEYSSVLAKAVVIYNATQTEPYEIQINGDELDDVMNLYENIMSGGVPTISFIDPLPEDREADDDEEDDFDSGTLN